MSYSGKLEEFKELIKKIEYLKYTLNSLVYWDKLVCMPPDAIEYRSDVMSFFGDQLYKALLSKDFIGFVKYFEGNKNNDEITNATINRIKSSSKYINMIPEEEYSDYIHLIAVSEQVWEKAKENNDFETFRPNLEKIIGYFKSFAEYWGYEGTRYDALMGYYEENLSVSSVDSLVNEIKPVLIDLISKINIEGKKASKKITFPNIDENKQMKISKEILKEIGFNFNAGRIDIGSHPTILPNSPKDVRIITSIDSDDFRNGLFNVLHEGGKGIYQQGIDMKLLGTFLAEPPSFALEEGIGRFYENIIGRSKGFWDHFLPKMCEIAPELKNIDSSLIFESVNSVNPSLIRIDADELTYMLHIIIRYEIEKDLINGDIEVKDVTKIWNEKYKEYLGVEPKNDKEGVLQDIHWAAGYIGYFPSYFVANLASAQLYNTMKIDVGNVEQLISEGNFNEIHMWLEEKVFKFGAKHSTNQLVEQATGEKLNSRYYIEYLRDKYSEIYNF